MVRSHRPTSSSPFKRPEHESIPFRRPLAAAFLLATGLSATAAQAQGPEQYNEPGPSYGRWNLEYTGQLASPGNGVQSSGVELLYGLTDRLALSLEAEAEREGGRIGLDELAIGATWSLNGAAPVEANLFAQATLLGGLLMIGGWLFRAWEGFRNG